MARTEQDIHEIAVELKQIRKVLERIAQAPIFSLNNEVHYLCDEKACSDCYEDCRHTKKIEHAKNFYLDRDSGVYIELDSDDVYNLPQ